METASKAKQANQKAAPKLKGDKPKVGPHAEDAYKHLGYGEDLPEDLLKVHRSFKRAKNKLTPGGRISPEGFAAIVAIYEAGLE